MDSESVPQKLSIEQRVATLERQVASILQSQPPEKDWKRMIGTWKDDELSREIDRLGQEWRAGADARK